MTAHPAWKYWECISPARSVVLLAALAFGLATTVAHGQGVAENGRVIQDATPVEVEQKRLAAPFERMCGVPVTWSADEPGKPMMELSLYGGKVSDAAMSAPDLALDRIGVLNLQDVALTDAGLATLSKMTGLRNLFIRGNKFTDAGLAHLGALTGLRDLEIESNSFTDAGLAHLAGLKNLRSLAFESKKFTDAGLAHLSGLTKLEVLILPRMAKLGDGGLAHLRSLTNLTLLDARWSSVGDAGMAGLEGMKRLETLVLASTDVGDAGLSHLSGLARLKSLNLMGTSVTGAGLARLKGLPRLEWLCLNVRQLDEEGIANLKGFPALKSLLVIGMDADSARTAATRRALPRVDLPSGSPRLPDPKRGSKGPPPANAPRPGNWVPGDIKERRFGFEQREPRHASNADHEPRRCVSPGRDYGGHALDLPGAIQ